MKKASMARALKKVEKSAADTKMDKKVKEGSPKDMALDRGLARKMMGRGKKK